MNNIPDPISKLTKHEKILIKKLSKLPREEILKELKDNLQTAIWIELATIPIYLYAYYSIERDEQSGEEIRPADLFANKAGGVIMSVAVEEMLHMSLSCNILFSLGVDPQLYKHSPWPYPTPLPYHKPVGPPGPEGKKDAKVLIPLSKFSYEQLWHFLQIEYPERKNAWPEDRNWKTIGQFYSYIRCLICCPQITDKDFRARGADSAKYQIQPYNYSPNNIDTAHPKEAFNSWGIPPAQGAGTPAGQTNNYPGAAEVTEFSDLPDSHAGPTQLLTVASKLDALEAITTICDQGEGFAQEATDDPTHVEDSHYYKFLKLQAQLEEYPLYFEKLPRLPRPPAPIEPTVTDAGLSEVILNFPDNPTTLSYYYANPPSVDYRPLSDLVNGVYQYMLILTETIFRVPDEGPRGGGQKLYFNEAMHRSMIWVLDKIIQVMRRQELGNGYRVAPTFENIDLGLRQDAFANLLKLAEATKGQPYYSDLEYYIGIIGTLPDVSKYWGGPPSPGEPTPKPYPYKDAPLWPKQIGSQPAGLPLHACMGLNSCKGSDRFGTTGHAGVPNDCAGQGYCSTTADHTCHVKNDCKNQGGCGLYGTAEELDNPAANDCKSLGSCATPINAERFSTNGPNQGKSVWKRAREVFEKNWPERRKEVAGAPETLGPAPAPFTDTGPPYLWITNDNEERDNMTACGASGLSGAGGCS